MPLLPDAETFRRLIDGSRRGVAPILARAALATLSLPYEAVVRMRNAAYDRGLLPAFRADAPVISVGNLTLGGTGKTPLVAWVARTCLALGSRPAIVSRGYGAARGQVSDEAAELAILLPGVPHVANRDRVIASAAAVAAGADAIVMDDGFQHRRLVRDLDIVTIDATDPFGCGRLFPGGLLREPLVGIERAGAVVLTRADTVSPERRREIVAVLSDLCHAAGPRVWAEAVHAPRRLRTAAGGELPLDALRGRRVAAFCGIGNPAAFRLALERLETDLVWFQSLPDHHAYTDADAIAIARQVTAARAEIVATTLKDLVKVRRDTLGEAPLAALEVAIDFPVGERELAELVGTALRGGAAGPRSEGSA